MSCSPPTRRILIGRLGLSRPYRPNLQRANEGEYSGRADRRIRRGTERIRGGGDWAVEIEGRSRALASDGEFPDSLYREAVKRLPAPPRRRCVAERSARTENGCVGSTGVSTRATNS